MIKIYNYLISNLIIILFILKRFIVKENYFNYEVIIFSYNRALQLDALLKSLIKLFDKNINLNILYRYDSQSIGNDYIKLINKYQKNKNIFFIKEKSSFKSSLNNLIKKIKYSQTKNLNLLFFVDDQILFKEIKIESLIKLSKYSPISTLRLGLNTKWSYNLNKKQSFESYRYITNGDCIQWIPKFKNDEISYVFSFDGSTIPLVLFDKFTKYLFFKGPNSLESSMNYSDLFYKIFKQKISSFNEQSVVNIVISQVQKETNNRGKFVDVNKLKYLFDNQWELKLDNKKIKYFNSPHIDYGFYFEKKGKKMYIDYHYY